MYFVAFIFYFLYMKVNIIVLYDDNLHGKAIVFEK